MRAVYKRELKSYMQSITGWLFIAVNLLFIGIYFTAFNLSMGYPYISYAISSALFIFLIITPILTMKSLSEERKQKTDQLLLTSPTSIFRIVLGKYLAMVTIFLIPVIIVCIYPVILGTFGSVPYVENYIAILGYFLFGASCIAIGLFLSSVTENQIIAAVLTFALLFLSYLMSGITNLISSTGNMVTKILSCFNTGLRVNDIMNGVFDLNAVIYFVTLIGVFLFLTYESIQKRRFSISTGTIRLSAYSSTMIVIVLAIAVAINLVAGQLPAEISKIDVTKDQIYTLTDQTKEFTNTLDEDITIYALSKEEDTDSVVSKILKKYDDLSSHIKVVYKDPSLYPNFASEYTTSELEIGSLIVEGEKRSKAINFSDLFESEVDYQTYQQKTTGFDGEGQITSALAYVISDELPKMYAISGHGEAELSATLTGSITKENIETESINLMICDKVPEDAAAIFILSPTKDFSKEDTQKVLDYLKSGGKAFIMSSYSEEKLTNFESIMNEYGVSVVDGVVAEGDSDHYTQNPFYLLPEVKPDDITNSIVTQKRYVFLPYAQGIKINENLREGLNVKELLTTSDSSYAKINMNDAASASKEEGDIEGPFALGVYVSEPSGDKETQIVYFTTENMLTDSVDAAVSGSNTELVVNALSKMIDHEVTISIPVKAYDSSTLTIAKSNMAILSLLFTILLPLGCLIAGIVIWLRRRKK